MPLHTTGMTHSPFLLLPPSLPMQTMTQPPVTLRNVFPAKTTEQKEPDPKPVPPVATAKPPKAKKLWWAYLTNRGAVAVMRYVAEVPADEVKLLQADALDYKDYSRLSSAAFKNWFDDGDKSTITQNFQATSRTDAQANAAKLLATAKAAYKAAKKSKVTIAK